MFFFQPGQLIPAIAPLRPALTVATITLIVCLTKHHLLKKIRLPKSKTNTYFAIFTALAVISMIKSIDLSVSFLYLRYLFKSLALYVLLLYSVNSEYLFNNILWTLINFTTIVTTTTIYAYYKGLMSTRMVSYFGGMEDSNGFGIYLVMILPIIAIFLINKKKIWTRLYIIFSLSTVVYCILRTYSRGTFLGMISVFGVIFIKNVREVSYLIMVTIFIGFVIYKTPTSYWNRISTIWSEQPQIDVGAIDSRKESFSLAADFIKENPLLGVGLGNFFTRWVAMLGNNDTSRAHVTHNTYLEIASETGLVRLFIFLMLINSTFKNLRMSRKIFINNGDYVMARITDAFSASLVGYLVCAMFISQQYNRFFYIIVALSVISSKFSSECNN